MKKLLFLSFLTIISLLAACSSDDSNNETVNPEDDCEAAIEATAEAAADYQSATEDNFPQACAAYKAALQNQKAECGDANGALQALINGLGDCTVPGPVTDGTVTVTAGTLAITFDEVTVVQEGATLKVTAETSAQNDYSIYFEIEEGAEGEDIVQNFQIQLISLFHAMEGEFHSTIETNANGMVSGTFYGYVQNNDNATISLTSGNIDLDFE